MAPMEPLQCIVTHCTFCGEAIELLVDCSLPEQTYVEDCSVCCRPLLVSVRVDGDGDASVSLRNEND